MNNLSNVKYIKYQIVAFLFCFILVIFRLLNVSVYDTSRARADLNGDGYSDINTISSAKYFNDSGFINTAFLPVHDYYPELKQTNAYTHYPAIPNVFCGFYTYIFNSYKEPLLRIIPALLSILFFFFIFKVIKTITQSNIAALCGGLVLVLANYYIAWADNLHQHLYGEFLKWIYFYLLYNYYIKNKSWTYFIPMLLIMVLEVNISFEQPVFLGILTLGFSIIFRKKVFSFETISAASFVIIGFGLHILQNTVYFNSLPMAIDDMKSAFMLRTAGVELTVQKSEAEFGIKTIFEIPFNWFNRMERFYLFPGWAILIIGIIALKDLRKTNKELYQIIWAVFFASIGWSILMAQHGYVHSFTNKHFSIFYALLSAISIPVFYENFKNSITQKNKRNIAFYTLLSLYALVMFITQQAIPYYYQYSIGYK